MWHNSPQYGQTQHSKPQGLRLRSVGILRGSTWCSIVRTFMTSARVPDEAASLMQQAEKALTLNLAFVTPLCTSIAANLGLGTIGIAAYPI